MKPTRRQFLQTSALATMAAAQPLRAKTSPQLSTGNLDAYKAAQQHLIVGYLPTPNFFEGMLLGNGDVGVCVVVRPDALGLHIGKSDCWDIRVSGGVDEHVLPFSELLKLWQRAGEEAKRQGKPDMQFLEGEIDFFREYTKSVETSYIRPWPRPWPCGTVWLHWDSRWVTVRQQTLNPANGLFTLSLMHAKFGGNEEEITLHCFVDWSTGLISVVSDKPAPILSVSYQPRVDDGVPDKNDPKNKWGALPPPELTGQVGSGFAEFSFFQYFPAVGPTEKQPAPPRSDKDRNFSLSARLDGNWKMADDNNNNEETSRPHNKAISFVGKEQPLQLNIQVATPRDQLLKRLENEAGNDRNPWILIPQNHAYSPEDLDTLSYAKREVDRLSGQDFFAMQRDSEMQWRKFWSASAVAFEDKELEKIWYQNQYFLACCLREHKVAPGLFGNWSSGNIGTDWHGDYHMNYNCQQVWWGTFSSNHVEQHLPYVELCHNLMPIVEKFAGENFGLPGAAFPVSAYPVPNESVSYPGPPWAYQISMTPWSVQSLWWQYLYTQDIAYLKRVYPMLRSAAQFIGAYAQKGADGKYHIIPTVSSENWGFTVDFRMNKDCILDLSLSQFLLNAVVEASGLLQVDDEARKHWKDILNNFAPYPTGKGPHGEVWVDVIDAPVEHVYNVPITLSPVFPAEQVGIGHGEPQWELAQRTTRTMRLEGGNDLVYQPLIRARMGMLDLAWFKREVAYCLLPNGAANDRVRQIGGRYDDSTDFDYMMRMGYWVENFALPAVLNECMMQSYSSVIRLFPNTQNLGAARFENLRAAGAFLVSAAYDGKAVTQATILSEKGRTARVAASWGPRAIKVTRLHDRQKVMTRMEKDVVVFDTQAGESYSIEPA